MTPGRWAAAAWSLTLLALASQLLPFGASPEGYLPLLGIPVEIPATGAPDPVELELPAGRYLFSSTEPTGGARVLLPRAQVMPAAFEATHRENGVELRLPVRVRGIRFETSPPQGASIQAQLVPLEREPGMGLPILLREARHQVPRSGSGRRPGMWLYLDGPGAYDFEGEGFWLQGDGATRLLLLAAEPLPALELRFHALTAVTVVLPEGTLPVGPDRTERVLVTPRLVERSGTLHLYAIPLGCRDGIRPSEGEGDPAGSRDRRFLGAFCQLPEERDALWVADRLLAEGRVEEARAELGSSGLPAAQVALLALDPLAAHPVDTRESPWPKALAWAGARRSLRLGDEDAARDLLDRFPAGPPPAPPEGLAAYPELGALLRQPGDLTLRDGLELLGGSAPRQAAPIASFGPLRVLGARVQPASAPPGGAVELELELRRTAAPAPDVLLRIHAVPGRGSRAGHLLGRLLSRATRRPRLLVADHRPARGVGPPAVWMAGEVVLDRCEIALPAGARPGEQAVLLSVVDRRSGREILEEGVGRAWIRIARFRVEP